MTSMVQNTGAFRTLSTTRWMEVPVVNIKGKPEGIQGQPLRCWVKAEVNYSPLAQIEFFDIFTHIEDGEKPQRYLTASEDKMTFNGKKIALDTDRFNLIINIIKSAQPSIHLDFCASPRVPDVEITY